MADTPSYEQKTEIQFDSLIKVALKNEVISFQRKMRDEYEKQSLFCELDEGQVENIADNKALEAFNHVGTEFQVMQYTVDVCDALLYEALSQVDEVARNMVLMRHWLEMKDQEIANATGIERRKVKKIRKNTYTLIEKILEAKGYGKSSFVTKKDV